MFKILTPYVSPTRADMHGSALRRHNKSPHSDKHSIPMQTKQHPPKLAFLNTPSFKLQRKLRDSYLRTNTHKHTRAHTHACRSKADSASIPSLIQSLVLRLHAGTPLHLDPRMAMLVTHANSMALRPRPRSAHAGTCACTFTHMHKCSCKYIPGNSLHLCQRSISPAFTSSVSYTLRSMQTRLESLYKPSVLTLSFSPCSFAPRFSVPPFPFPLFVTSRFKTSSCF